MKRKVHVIAGLPRTGSTLLANILPQNPNIHTTPTSGCAEVLAGIRDGWRVHHRPDEKQSEDYNLRRVLQSVLDNYHDTDREIVFDKFRGWTRHIEMLEWILERNVKMIITLRPITQILSSFEKIHRDNIKNRRHKGPLPETDTIAGRCRWLLDAEKGVVGKPYTQLQEVIQKGHRDRLLLIEYDQLCSQPQETLNEIYDFIEEPRYKHDFKKVEQYTIENDEAHGFNKLHTIRSVVKPQKDDSVKILGTKVMQEFGNLDFWKWLD